MQIPTTTNQSQEDNPQFVITSMRPPNSSSESNQIVCSPLNDDDSNECQEAKTIKPIKRNHLYTKRKHNSSLTTNDVSNNKRCLLTDNNKQSRHIKRLNKREKNAAKQCPVCGDTASSHIHYGGRSCASCRAFFRRSVVKQSR